MFLNIAIIVAVLVSAALLFSPRLMKVERWRAMTTPLASIIGSGFLVLGPILDTSYGRFAPLVMAALCAGAYLFGAAIRFNIARRATGEDTRSATEKSLDRIASWALAFAYIISVAYYLNLLGAFGLTLTPLGNPFYAECLTTAVFIAILAVGWMRGFKMLERMEYISVAIKLSVIVGLLVGLLVYFAIKAANGGLLFKPAHETGWSGIALAFGLLVTVQGFETSRYLGADYTPEMRIRSMKLAQWVSSGIYMVYIVLLAYVIDAANVELTETAIVDMLGVVAPVLPAFLVAAALSAQFSAAVADTSGAGGLFAEVTKNRITARRAYALLVVAGLTLTWTLDVFQIISYASRAFAAYYALQAAIACIGAVRSRSRWRAILFFFLAILGMIIVIFGQAVEV